MRTWILESVPLRSVLSSAIYRWITLSRFLNLGKTFAPQVLESVDVQIKKDPHTRGQGSDMAEGLRKKLSSLEDVRKASQRR